MDRKEIHEGLRDLIDAGAGEQDVQEHLEKNPWMISQIEQLDPSIIVSKIPLGSAFKPDFAFFWSNSGGQFIKLIEIESPSLNVFTQKDEFTSEFNHAVQQLADWTHWCETHPDGLDDILEPLFDEGHIVHVPSYTQIETQLIAGRRSDVLKNTRRKHRWQGRVSELGRRTLRTWDGFLESFPDILFESPSSTEYIKCFRYRAGRYDVISDGS